MTDKNKPTKPKSPPPVNKQPAKPKPVGRAGAGGSFKPSTRPAPGAPKRTMGSSIKQTGNAPVRPIQQAAASMVIPAGLSADLSAQLQTLDSRLTSLQSQLGFDEHYRAVADLDSGISALEEIVADCRRRGYCYQNFLERKVQTLGQKWLAARPLLLGEMEQSGSELQMLLSSAVNSRNAVASGAQIPLFSHSIEALSARTNSAENALRAIYGGIRDTYYQTRRQVEAIQTMLADLEMASFPLLAGESPVQAVKAKWWRDGQNAGPEGLLYLTDQRLLFEQKEEVATKKVLFITTETETVRQLVFDAPLGSLQSVKSSARGLMGHEDHLDFEFGSGAPYPMAHFHLDGQESDQWVGLVKRVQSGDIQSERYAAPGTEAPSAGQGDAAAVHAPQNCTSCGAPVAALIVHGQRQIICDYCGTTMRW